MFLEHYKKYEQASAKDIEEAWNLEPGQGQKAHPGVPGRAQARAGDEEVVLAARVVLRVVPVRTIVARDLACGTTRQEGSAMMVGLTGVAAVGRAVCARRGVVLPHELARVPCTKQDSFRSPKKCREKVSRTSPLLIHRDDLQP